MQLSFLCLSKYYLTESGRLYSIDQNKEILQDSEHRFYLQKDSGKFTKISLKSIYQKVYNKEYCTDEIINKPFEQWKEIEHTHGKYYISNCGRVKSYCRYNAIILQQYTNNNNYLVVKINRKNMLIHRLVALAFCENNYKGQAIEIHHKDGNKQNNNADNLQILSVKEHHKIHNNNRGVKNGRV